MSKEFHSDYEDDTTKSPNTRTKRISSYKYRKCFFKSPTAKPLQPRRENSSVITSRTSLNLPDIRRFDAYGTPIKKGGRTHKVTFVDQLQNTNIAQIQIIKEEKPSFSSYHKANIGRNNNKCLENGKMIMKKNSFRVNNKEEKKTQQTNLKCEACLIF